MCFSDSLCRIIWLSLVGIVLTGCGGGGSGGAPPPPTVVVDPNLTVPLQTAMANLVNNGLSQSYSLTGWIDNSTSTPLPHTPLSGSGTVTIGTPISWVFSSGPLTGVVILKSVAVFTGAAASTATYYFSTADYTILAINSGGYFSYYSPYTIPATVKAGDTGATGGYHTGSVYSGDTTTGVYSVASDRANSLLVSFIETVTSIGYPKKITSTVYRIDTLGAISPASITIDNYFLGQWYQHVVLTF